MAAAMEIDFGFDKMDIEVSDAAQQTALQIYNKHYLGGMSGAMQRKVIEKVGTALDVRDEQVNETMAVATEYIDGVGVSAERVRDAVVSKTGNARNKSEYFQKALAVYRAGGTDAVVFNKALAVSTGKVQFKAAVILSDQEVTVGENEPVSMAKLFVDVVRKVKGLRVRTNEELKELSPVTLKVVKFKAKLGKDRFEKDADGKVVIDDDGKRVLKLHEQEKPTYTDNVYGSDDFDKSKPIIKHGETKEETIDGKVYFVTTQQRWKLVPPKYDNAPTEEISAAAREYFDAARVWAHAQTSDTIAKFVARNKVAQGNPIGTLAGGKATGELNKKQTAVLRHYTEFFAHAPDTEDIAAEINRATQQHRRKSGVSEQLQTTQDTIAKTGNSSSVMKNGLDQAVRVVAAKQAMADQAAAAKRASLRSNGKRDRSDDDDASATTTTTPKRQRSVSSSAGPPFRGKGAAYAQRIMESKAAANDDSDSDDSDESDNEEEESQATN